VVDVILVGILLIIAGFARAPRDAPDGFCLGKSSSREAEEVQGQGRL